MWNVKEPRYSSKRVGREVPDVVALLSVVNTGLLLIAVSITEMVILSKYVVIIIIIIIIIITIIIIIIIIIISHRKSKGRRTVQVSGSVRER